MHSTILSELSSTVFGLCSSIDTLLQVATAIPQHPYDILKYSLFDKEHTFPTISDIEVPETVELKTIIKGLEVEYDNYQERVLDFLKEPKNFNLELANEQMSPLAELSGNNTYVVTTQKQKAYIEALELIQSVDLNSINNNNSREIVNKLGFTILKLFHQKTI